MTRAQRLKAARKALGFTDRQMAAALQLRGVNAKDDLRKMEDGMREVTGPVLVASEALVRTKDLLAEIADLERAIKRADTGNVRSLAALVLAAGGRLEVHPSVMEDVPNLTLHKHEDPRTGSDVYEVTR